MSQDEKELQPKWYVVHTYSGYEMMVKDSLEKLQNLRNFRNGLVHGIDNPAPAVLIRMGDDVREILSELTASQTDGSREPTTGKE